LEVLCEPGAWHELRTLNGNGRVTASGYFNDSERMAKAAHRLNRRGNNVYFTLNPVQAELSARAVNHVVEWPKHTTADEHIISRRWLLVDIDPKRLSGIAASNQEHDAALARAQQIRQWAMEERNWPAPATMDSGNGAYLLWRVALPNNDEARQLVTAVLQALAARFDDTAVTVDVTTSNASRIARMPTTLNKKGDDTASRPHRLAQLIDLPLELIPISREQLQQVASEFTASADLHTQPPASTSPELQRVLTALEQHNITAKEPTPYKSGLKYVLNMCLFNPNHGGTSVAIIEYSSGAKQYSCLHAECEGKKWGDVMRLLGLGKKNAGVAASQEQANGAPARDPRGSESQTQRIKANPVDAEIRTQESPSAPEEMSEDSHDHQIAQDLFDLLKEYIVIGDNELFVLTLSVLHTHSFRTGYFAVYVNVCAPEKESGKTRVLLVLKRLVRNPLYTENISPAALARTVELEDGTMLIDEIDTVLGPKANKEVRETIRGILNSGYHRSGTYVRMDGVGTNMKPHKFSTFCPKIFAGLGLDSLPDTTASRTIPIHIRRAKHGECKRFRPDGNGKAAKQLHQRLEGLRVRAARWAKRHAQQIADAEPDYPTEFTDRQCDISEPLLAVASVLGEPWVPRLTSALTAINNSLAAEDNSMGVLLLGHIRKVFLDKDTTRLHTEDLLAGLCAIPEAPWKGWNKGKGFDDRAFSKLVKGYDVKSTTVRAPLPGKGYKLEQFYDAFERYLKPVCMCPDCDCHEACNGMCNGICNAAESEVSPNNDAGCNDVTAKTGVGGEGGRVN
jgi:hypothetical protein